MKTYCLSVVIATVIVLPLLATPAATLGCNACSEETWGYPPTAFANIPINATATTPLGTPYDPSGLPINPALIDRLSKEVATCLNIEVDYSSFQVKVMSDWVLSCDGSQQLLPIEAPNSGCYAKGETPTAECPCRWRAGIACKHDGSASVAIITTPSFYLYKDALTRFLANSNNPWSDAKLEVCATPSTTPLSDGADANNGL